MNARNVIVRIVLLLGAVLLVAGLILTSSRRTVSSDAKAAHGIRYGYQLDSYRFRNRMFLRFWSSSGLQFDADLPGYFPREVNEARWIAADSAVYLNTTVVHREAGGEKTAPMRILFNFRSGQVLVTSPLPLWRVPPGAQGTKWLTDEEFDAALAGQ